MNKKSEYTEQEEEETKPLSYNELHETPIEDILASDNGDDWEAAEEKAGLVPEDEGKEVTTENAQSQEEIKTEEAQPQAPVEEPKPQEQPQPDQKLDAEQLKSEIASEVVKALSTGEETKQEKDDLMDQVQEMMKEAPWVKEGRDPTYLEAITWTTRASLPLTVKQAKEQLIKEMEEEDLQEQEQQKQVEEQNQKVQKAWHAQWDQEFKDLEASGEIPPVKASPSDQKAYQADPGVKARVEIMQKMTNESQKRQSEGKPILTNVVQTYYQYIKPTKETRNNQPPGADAPVFGASKTVTPTDTTNYSYNDIHNKSIYDLLSEK